MLSNCLGVLLCLFLSALYHTFNSKDQWTQNFLVRIDYAGISLLILGTSMAPANYIFVCGGSQEWRIFFTGYLTLVCFAAFLLTVVPYFNRPGFQVFRISVFGVNGFSALAPYLVAWTYESDNNVIRQEMSFVAIGASCYVLGGLIYAFLFPECCRPGKFDIFGASHQIFHTLIVIGSLSFFYSNYLLLQERQNFVCQN